MGELHRRCRHHCANGWPVEGIELNDVTSMFAMETINWTTVLPVTYAE
jgi:hypothetical protein